MPISKRDRYRGAMLGVLCGDALGAPYETWDVFQIAEDMRRRGGLVPFDYVNPWAKVETPLSEKTFPAGRPTDDSDQTAALAQSLIERNGINEANLFHRLRAVVFDHVSPLWEGRAYGAGRTTREALRPPTWLESQSRPFTDEYPSNGSLMRAAPMALFIGTHKRAEALDAYWLTTRMARVTHRNKYAGIYTALYVEILLDILNDVYPPIYLEGHHMPPVDPGQWPERGNVEFSFRAALWAFRATDFRTGITRAIAVGGDTDTYGAIAGGLLGAYYGIEGIPLEWRKVLKGHDVMIELADKLYDIAHAQSSS